MKLQRQGVEAKDLESGPPFYRTDSAVSVSRRHEPILTKEEIMEPVITTIAAAVALGAAESLKTVAAEAVKESWAALKKMLHDRYGSSGDVTDAVDYVAKKPEAAPRRQMLEQALKEAGADKDQELAKSADNLLAAIEQHNPNAAAGIGMDIGTLKAARLDVSNVLAAQSGTGVKIGTAEIAGEAVFSNIGGCSPKR